MLRRELVEDKGKGNSVCVGGGGEACVFGVGGVGEYYMLEPQWSLKNTL